MPDQDHSVGRVCGSCGRRVPRSVATCRCGATLPVVESAAVAPAAEETPSGGSGSVVTAVVVGLLAIAGVGYWTFKQPAAVTPALPQAAQPIAATAPAETGASPRSLSAEARAWDAAANARPEPSRPDAPEPLATSPITGLSASIEEMVARAMPAVVLIETTTGRGSGFFVARDTLITNVHVVQNDSYVTLRRMDGSTTNANVHLRAPGFDIAVLKVAQPSPSQAVIPMGSAHSLRAGQEVIVIGSALGMLHNSVSRGVVSGLRKAGNATLVQTDAASNPGNSGGPMLDRNGAVIGITTMGYKNSEGLNFGVAIDHARDLMEGRERNLGRAGDLAQIDGASTGSETDRQQQQGEERFRSLVREMSTAAQRLDNAWRTFRTQCYKSPIAGNYDREWFAVLVPRDIPGDAASGCMSYYGNLESDIKRFKELMNNAIGDARRASVMPGTIREVLASNRLNFDWDR
jgi:S1-C subfamily serine protease